MSKSIYPSVYSKEHLIKLYSNYTDDYSDLDDNLYCVYLIVNLSEKLPPYYIGSSSVKNIKSGYMGTISSKRFKNIYNKELKSNPHLFKMIILDTFTDRSSAVIIENWMQRLYSAMHSIDFINMSYAVDGFSGCNTGMTVINNGEIEKYCSPENLESFLESGWKKGFSDTHKQQIAKTHTRPMKGRMNSEETRRRKSEAQVDTMYVHKDGKMKRIFIKDLQYYIDTGYSPGNDRHQEKNPMYNITILNNGESTIYIHKEEAYKYLNAGWVRGSLVKPALGKIFIHNSSAMILIFKDELESYLSLGWKEGTGMGGNKNPMYGTKRRFMWHKDFPRSKRVKLDDIEKYLEHGWIFGIRPK